MKPRCGPGGLDVVIIILSPAILMLLSLIFALGRLAQWIVEDGSSTHS
jgi:ABC-type uncharacterized transport system permease subunit